MAKRKTTRITAPDSPIINGVDEPQPSKFLSEEDEIQMLERELRRYVRRSGGFRKGLSGDDQKRAEKIMKKLGRTEAVWAKDIIFPDGIDKPTVADMKFSDV